MKGCPRCESVHAWVLGDGRRKCQSCGCRYSCRSVWDSIRLGEPAKQALLDAFVRGVPAAQCVVDQACADSRERFYRLVRACCARHESVARDGLSVAECRHVARGARPTMRGWSTSSSVVIVGIAERATVIHISAPLGVASSVLPLLRERTAVGGVVQFDDTQAYACLPIQGQYVIVPRTTRAALVMRPAEAFWHYARVHLQVFRKVPVRFFRLYLAEACLRFNHRDQDLRELLHRAMQSTDIGELKPLLKGDSRMAVLVPSASTRVDAPIARQALHLDASSAQP